MLMNKIFKITNEQTGEKAVKKKTMETTCGDYIKMFQGRLLK